MVPDKRRPQLISPPGFDLHRPIQIARPRSQDTASRTRALRPDPPVGRLCPWHRARPVSLASPPRSLTALARWSVCARALARGSNLGR
jgi:hypothetical protein